MTPWLLRRLALPFCCLCLSAQLVAQDQMAKAKALYNNASYEEALAILDKEPVSDTIELAEYRLLCLLALGRSGQAQLALDTLLLSHPRYRPDPEVVSPRRRAEIEAAREKIIRRRYAEAKESFEMGDYRAAAVRFDRVVEELIGAAPNPALADMKMLSTGFRDLSKVNANSPYAAPPPEEQPVGTAGVPAPNVPPESNVTAPVASPVSPPVPAIFDASTADVVPPVPLKPIMPPAAPPQPTPGSGLFEIVIDETGRVESAAVRRPISPQYDKLLLDDARTWRYRPAMRAGKPVKFRKVIEIYTTALSSIKRD
jgi:tetratricopeptide (TPR) repeat protein